MFKTIRFIGLLLTMLLVLALSHDQLIGGASIVNMNITGAINPLSYGVVCNGSTDNTAAFSRALTAAANKVLEFPPSLGTCLLQSNVTTPTGTTIIVEPGTTLAPASGYTLMIDGPFHADGRAFGGAGTSVVANQNLNPIWWGADPTGSNNSLTAFQAAVTSAQKTSGGTISHAARGCIIVAPGKYLLAMGKGSGLNLTNWDGQCWKGYGGGVIAGSEVLVPSISNITITSSNGNSNTNAGIDFSGSEYGTWDKISVICGTSNTTAPKFCAVGAKSSLGGGSYWKFTDSTFATFGGSSGTAVGFDDIGMESTIFLNDNFFGYGPASGSRYPLILGAHNSFGFTSAFVSPPIGAGLTNVQLIGGAIGGGTPDDLLFDIGASNGSEMLGEVINGTWFETVASPTESAIADNGCGSVFCHSYLDNLEISSVDIEQNYPRSNTQTALKLASVLRGAQINLSARTTGGAQSSAIPYQFTYLVAANLNLWSQLKRGTSVSCSETASGTVIQGFNITNSSVSCPGATIYGSDGSSTTATTVYNARGMLTNTITVEGTATLVAGRSGGNATVQVTLSPGYSATGNYNCLATDITGTHPATNLVTQVKNNSATQFTIYAVPYNQTDNVYYRCSGH